MVSVKSGTVYVNGFQASGQVANDEAAWTVAHSLLRRYGISLLVIAKPSRVARPLIRTWYIKPPDNDAFSLDAKTLGDAKELARLRLDRKRLPKGTEIMEEV